MTQSETTAPGCATWGSYSGGGAFFPSRGWKDHLDLDADFRNPAPETVPKTWCRKRWRGALQTWPYYGHPEKSFRLDHPGSKKNLALDLIRRDKVFRNKEAEIAHLMEQISGDSIDETSHDCRKSNQRRPLAHDVYVLSFAHSAGDAGRARAQNSLRFQSPEK